MKGLRIAISFLTRIPAGIGTVTSRELGRAVVWFPVVGVLVGGSVGLVYWGALQLWPPLVAAALALSGGVFITGAFHEDGLADTIDAFGGGSTRDDVIRILKDPTHGTFGVLALIVSFIVRLGALASLEAGDAALVLVGAHCLSRATAVGLMGRLPPVGEGLGAAYASGATGAGALTGVGIGVAIGTGTLRLLVLPALGCCLLAALVVGYAARTKLGGVTGDVLGAVQQLSEMAILLVGAAGSL